MSDLADFRRRYQVGERDFSGINLNRSWLAYRSFVNLKSRGPDSNISAPRLFRFTKIQYNHNDDAAILLTLLTESE